MDAIIKALDHEVRRSIIRYINENPGARYSDILNEFKLRRGTLNFHLKLIQPLVVVEDSLYYLNEEGRKSIQMMRIMDGHESLKIKSLLFSAQDSIPNTKGFLGREQILKSVPGNRFLIIEGIAGIGKTFLLARMAQNMKAEVFWHQFRFVDTFDYVVQKLAVFLYKQGLEELLNYLESGGADRNVCLLILKRTLPSNNALFFDDLHLVEDKDIFLLLSSFKDAPCIVVITSRQTPRLEDFSENATKIKLEGFSREEAKRYLEIRGVKLKEGAFEKLFRKTGGHPLAIKFLSMSRDNIEEITGRIPEANIEGFLWTEIYAKLTKNQKELMRALSVFREKVPIEALKAVYEGDLMLETLLSLKEMLLVEEDARGYFTHDMVHEFCYRMIDDAETAHIKASKYYEKMSKSRDIVELIYHLLKAEEIEEATRIALSRAGKIIMEGYLMDFYDVLSLFKEDEIPQNNRARFYLVSGRILDIWGRWEEALDNFNKALSISSNEARKGEALRYIADIKRKKGEWEEAEKYYKQSEAIATEMEDMNGLSRIYADLGSIYRKKGELDRAMEYHEKSLKIREELGDKRGISQALGSLGSIYRKKGELDRAMEYHEKSLKIREELGDMQGMAQAYGSIGSIYRKKRMVGEALEYHRKSLEIREGLGDVAGVAIALGSLGACHMMNKEYGKAEECFRRSLEIRQELGDMEGQGNVYLNMAELAILRNDIKHASDWLLKARDIALKGNRILEGRVEREMGVMHAFRGDEKESATHFANAAIIFKTHDLTQELADTYLEYYKNIKDARSQEMLENAHNLYKNLGNEKMAKLTEKCLKGDEKPLPNL